MRVIHTTLHVPLAAVKPLEDLLTYRAFCLQVTRETLRDDGRPRRTSPIGGGPLEPFGTVDGLDYLRCAATGSLFLARVAEPGAWARLLAAVSAYRQSPDSVHGKIAQSRYESVYLPKLEWVGDTLRLHGMRRPAVLEVVTPPSAFTPMLEASGLFASVRVVGEMDLNAGAEGAEAAVMLEALDRVDDPVRLLRAVRSHLVDGGLLFVTAMAASGFDVVALGLRNAYLFPPDRTNCFTLTGLRRLVEDGGFEVLEASTPGVLDVEILQAHLRHDPTLTVGPFERRLLEADADVRVDFQAFLQRQGMSSFARLVARKRR